MNIQEFSKGFVLEQVGRPKGGQHHNGPVYYPAKLTHPDFPDIIIQVGSERTSTLHNMNVAKTLFIMAVEETYKVKIER